MSNVATIHSSVNNVSPEQIVEWHMQKAEGGEIKVNTARFRCTALLKLVEPLKGDERRNDPRWLLENIDELAARYARLNNAKADTTKTYQSRARSALSDYIAWSEDPSRFKFAINERSRGDRAPTRKAKGKKTEAAQPTNEVPPAQTASSRPATNETLRNYPLGGGRKFLFDPPEDLTYPEVLRISLHLLTLATDFDPVGNEEQRALFAIARKSS